MTRIIPVALIVVQSVALPSSLSSRDRGEAIFYGKEAVSGTIRGHQHPMPPEAVRCGNCHSAGQQPSVARSVAPRLTKTLLLEARERRNGPPSSYDEQGFCNLLRKGIDPSEVLIARDMPVYDLDSEQCASLWTFLTKRD